MEFPFPKNTQKLILISVFEKLKNSFSYQVLSYQFSTLYHILPFDFRTQEYFLAFEYLLFVTLKDTKSSHHPHWEGVIL